MYEGLRSPNIHTPTNIAEYTNTITHYQNTSLWAGGTYIMNQKNSYPLNATDAEIISLAKIEELHKFQRNDRMAEFGAMVKLNEIITVGKQVLPKVLLNALKSTASSMIRDRITIGGALCTPGIRTNISAILVLLDATADVKFTKKKRVQSKWVPVSRLYDKFGQLSLPQNALISRVRISIQHFDYQYFKAIDSPLTNSKEAVSLGFVCRLDQSTIATSKLIINFPNIGFCSTRDIDNIISGVQLPLRDEDYKEIEKVILTYIMENYTHPNPIQIGRMKGMLSELVSDLNQFVLKNRGSNNT